jgi:hypothetical protein
MGLQIHDLLEFFGSVTRSNMTHVVGPLFDSGMIRNDQFNSWEIGVEPSAVSGDELKI